MWPDALGSLATCLGDRVEIRTVQLHGHAHDGPEGEGTRQFDVGVDSIGAEPVPESEIIDQALAIDPRKHTDGRRTHAASGTLNPRLALLDRVCFGTNRSPRRIPHGDSGPIREIRAGGGREFTFDQY